MINYLKTGRLDWVNETAFSALIFQEKAGAELLLRRWKKGRAQYRCVFITRKDSGINKLEDLIGKKIALEDPGSTTGYFLPVSMIKQAGLKLAILRNPRDTAPPGAVGYVFAQGELNIAAMVHKGFVQAGGYSDLDWISSEDTPESFKKTLAIFKKSEPIPRSLELVRSDLPEKIKARLKQILLNAHKNPQGRAALAAYAKTTKFDEITPQVQTTLQKYRKMLSELNH